MLPLAHIYVSTKVAKQKSSLLVFGSILPDIAWTSKSEISRDQIHYAPNEFYKYITQHNPKLIDLGLGVKLHSNIDKGADYYSDDLDIGFAKIEGRKIESEVAKLLSEEKSEKSLVLAHNFIELSVDMLLLNNYPEILDLYRKSIENINLQEVANCLSRYLQLDEKIITSEIKNFLNYVGPIAYSSKESLIDKIIILIKQRKGADVDRNQTEEILQKSIELMNNKYQKYLDNAINNMQKDFSNLISNQN